MAVTVSHAGADDATRPAWLLAFDRCRLAPRQERAVAARGRSVLVFVLDGVLLVRHEVAALDRALPGELVCARGLDTLRYANGSNSDTLEVCEWALTGGAGAARIAQRYFSDDDQRGALCRVASAAGNGGGALAQGAPGEAFLATLGKWETVLHNPASGVSYWLHVFDGSVDANGVEVPAGASAWLRDIDEIRLSGRERASVLLLEGRDGEDGR